MKKHLILIAICLLASYPAGAQIQLSGNLSGTLVDTTYLVTGTITVQNGDSLTIQPGAVLSFYYDLCFIIMGYLYAVGTEQDSIKFINVTGGSRRGNIIFHSSADDSSRMEYCLINGGYAYNGGGIQCYQSSPAFSHCAISGNTASYGSGGGIYCYQSGSTFSYCYINENTAGYRSGGGIYCDNSNPTIDHCVISGNNANYSGGGIYCSYSNPTINYCAISGNRISDYGGGICCGNSSPSISHCLINGNSSGDGGGIYCYQSSSPNINYCTIAGNIADYYGGGIHCYGNSVLTGVNNIIWANSANRYSHVYGSFVFTYCDIQDGFVGTGNINADPLFYATTGDSAYRLTANSPCIDTGDPNSPLDPDSTRADMGAYYYHQRFAFIMTPHNPPIVIPAGGGSFTFDVVLCSRTANTVIIDAWAEVILANGHSTGALYLRANLLIPASSTIAREITQYVPGYAPWGGYLYVGKIGVYPDSIIDSDTLLVFKMRGFNGFNHHQGWACYGWDDNEEAVSIQHSGFGIQSCYPNPFNSSTVISFEMSDAGFVKLAVYDIAGREIITLVEGFYPAGHHQVVFEGTELASGVYFARLEAGGVMNSVKVLLMK